MHEDLCIDFWSTKKTRNIVNTLISVLIVATLYFVDIQLVTGVLKLSNPMII